MALPEQINYSEQGETRLLQQWKDKSAMSGLVKSFMEAIQDVEDLLQALLTERSIFSAVGEQLNVIGLLVGLKRAGRDDETYRAELLKQIARNRSDGTTEVIISLMETATQTTNSNFWEHYPASVFYLVRGGYFAKLKEILEGISQAGVRSLLMFDENDCFIPSEKLQKIDLLIDEFLDAFEVADGTTIGSELWSNPAALTGSGWSYNGSGSYTHTGTSQGEIRGATGFLIENKPYLVKVTAETPAAFSATLSDSFVFNGDYGIAFDGTNLVSTAFTGGSRKIRIHDGISSTILSSFEAPGSDFEQYLTVINGNLIVADPATDTIFVQDGISETTLTSFAAPSNQIRGISTDGTNLISCDSATETVYIHDGVSATISSSFVLDEMQSVAFTGTDLITLDSVAAGTVYFHDGLTSTINNSFAVPTGARDLFYYDDKVYLNVAGTLNIYDIVFSETGSFSIQLGGNPTNGFNSISGLGEGSHSIVLIAEDTNSLNSVRVLSSNPEVTVNNISVREANLDLLAISYDISQFLPTSMSYLPEIQEVIDATNLWSDPASLGTGWFYNGGGQYSHIGPFDPNGYIESGVGLLEADTLYSVDMEIIQNTVFGRIHFVAGGETNNFPPSPARKNIVSNLEHSEATGTTKRYIFNVRSEPTQEVNSFRIFGVRGVSVKNIKIKKAQVINPFCDIVEFTG